MLNKVGDLILLLGRQVRLIKVLQDFHQSGGILDHDIFGFDTNFSGAFITFLAAASVGRATLREILLIIFSRTVKVILFLLWRWRRILSRCLPLLSFLLIIRANLIVDVVCLLSGFVLVLLHVFLRHFDFVPKLELFPLLF